MNFIFIIWKPSYSIDPLISKKSKNDIRIEGLWPSI